jgi:4-hydroxy-3-methylbut-2-enyl diphosphate reductase
MGELYYGSANSAFLPPSFRRLETATRDCDSGGASGFTGAERRVILKAMKIIRAAVMGRCMGVKRAVDLALKAAAAAGESAVFTLGPLIHNPQAIAELERKGVSVLGEGDLDERVAGSVVIIRAHGAPPELLGRLKDLGATIVDATCPRVLASQRKARDFHAKGYTVVLAGDLNHGEVAGIVGQAPGALVVGGAEEAAAVAKGIKSGKVALLAQTTIGAGEYAAIRAELEALHPSLVVVDSICPATEERQDALAGLARSVDAIVVVGGKDSANTQRLYRTAASLGLPAWLVETAAELPEELYGIERVGLTAGASTPDGLVDEVELSLLYPKSRAC